MPVTAGHRAHQIPFLAVERQIPPCQFRPARRRHLDSVRRSSAVRACSAQAVRAAALLEVKWVSIGKPEWSSSEPSLTLSGQDSRTLSHSYARRLSRAVPPPKPSRLDRLQRDGLVSGWRLTG